MNSKIVAFVSLTVVLMMTATCFTAVVSSAEDELAEGGTIIENNDDITETEKKTTVEGSINDGFVIKSPEGTVGKVTITNLIIVSPSNSAITINGAVELTISGICNITGLNGHAAISVNEGNTLTLCGDSEKSENVLTVKGSANAAAIGGDNGCDSGAIIIDAGSNTTINASTTGGAACIGGGNNGDGNVTISSGNINCRAPGNVAIGAGNLNDHTKYTMIEATSVPSDSTLTAIDVMGYDGNVTITGGNIKTEGTIGGGKHTNDIVTITGGNVDVRNGSIGNTYGTSAVTDANIAHPFTKIIIGGTANVSAITYFDGINLCDFDDINGNKALAYSPNSSTQALNAAIGSAYGADTSISIEGSANVRAITVTRDASDSKYYQGAPGIGAGYHGISKVSVSTTGVVTAIGASSAPGIGNATLPVNYNSSIVDETEKKTAIMNIEDNLVKISSGTIYAQGGVYAPGIGGGRGTPYINVDITGGKITAVGGGNIIGYKEVDGETVIDLVKYSPIDDTENYIACGGAGIGAGYGGDLAGDTKVDHYAPLISLNINISGNAEIKAIGVNSDGIGTSTNTIVKTIVKETDVITTVNINIASNSITSTVTGESEKIVGHSLITVSAENGTCTINDGAVTINGSMYIKNGTTLTFVPTANSGYEFGTSSIEAVDGIYSYTVNGDATITFTFNEVEVPTEPETPVVPVTPVEPVVPSQPVIIPTYKVEIPVNDGYTIVPKDNTTVSQNGSFSFTIDFADGYNTDNAAVIINGNVVECVDGVYTVSGITSDAKIDISGCIKEYGFSYVDANAATEPIDMPYVLNGQDLDIDIVPKDRFVVNNVTVTVDGLVIENAYMDGIVHLTNAFGNVVITVDSTEITSAGIDMYLVAGIVAVLVLLLAAAVVKKKYGNNDEE